MKFGPVPLDLALGATLAHSVSLPTGRLRKGKRLEAGDLAQMATEGWVTVIVAELASEDMAEDDAARQVAAGLLAPGETGLRIGVAATGRVNLHATAPGVLRLDTAAIHALNRVNPMITLATLPPLQRVAAGEMVATVKIIAYGVPGGDVARAAKAGQGAISFAQPLFTTATLIETATDDAAPPLKGRDVLRARLARLGLTLTPRVVVRHDTDAIATAIAAAPGQVICLLTASATSDAADVGPAGLVVAGGALAQFGMPVDPGNLMFFGSLGPRPVIGLPGCARSPALNGADWVLERFICGVPLTPDDIAQMGVGGLLKEVPVRGRLRES